MCGAGESHLVKELWDQDRQSNIGLVPCSWNAACPIRFAPRSAYGCGNARGRRFTMDTSLTDEFIGQRLENYVIERLLGAGGMANVYRARDTLHRREVAIKALSPAFLTDRGYVERFRREAHHIAALEHPSIVPM